MNSIRGIVARDVSGAEGAADSSKRSVGPCVAKGSETGLALGNGGEGVQQVAGGAGEAVELGHREHVAGGELVERRAKLGAVGLGSARRLAEHLDGSGGGQRLDPRRHALAVRRYPCIVVNHAAIVQRILAAEKPRLFNALVLLRSS